MAGDTELMRYVEEEVERYEGIMAPVKASITERMFIKKIPLNKLHPNPDDEFCWPSIGPNYEIIGDYMAEFRPIMKTGSYADVKPLTVEKVRPDGYMILNGHHRWAAAKKLNLKKMPVQIVNLTQETDIKEMLRTSAHDKRAALDLDEVIFCEPGVASEKPLHFPYNRFYKERIRLGVPALLHFLSSSGYDIWVFSSKYYSFDYISRLFGRYSIRVDGIVTGTERKRRGKDAKEEQARAKKLFAEKYEETLFIDSKVVMRSKHAERDFDVYEINNTSAIWSQEVMRIIKGLK